jgi:hypothetical protein
MRGAAFFVGLGLLGCATAGGPSTPATATAKAPVATAPAKPARPELVVIGKGPEPMPGQKPADQGTEFVVRFRHTYRCTKVQPTAKNPEGMEGCRDITNGDSRNPDPGRVERSKTQGGWR